MIHLLIFSLYSCERTHIYRFINRNAFWRRHSESMFRFAPCDQRVGKSTTGCLRLANHITNGLLKMHSCDRGFRQYLRSGWKTFPVLENRFGIFSSFSDFSLTGAISDPTPKLVNKWACCWHWHRCHHKATVVHPWPVVKTLQRAVDYCLQQTSGRSHGAGVNG